MPSYLSRIKIAGCIILMAVFFPALLHAQGRTNHTLGMAYTHTLDFNLTINRQSDNKAKVISESFSGAAFIYEKPILQQSEISFMFGQMNRYSSAKLFSDEQRLTDVNEQIMWGQIGFNAVMRKVWVFLPYAGVNATYYSINATLKSELTNSTTTVQTTNPILDDKISASLVYLSVTFGLNYNFRYSGIKLFTQIFPPGFSKGGKINSNYLYSYNFSGYLLGVGFVAYF